MGAYIEFSIDKKSTKMRNLVLLPHAFLLSLLLFLSACPTQETDIVLPNTQRADIEKIYVFGDSLSDNGNLFSIINHLVGFINLRLQSPPAATGGVRFSDGSLIAEYVAAHYNIDLEPAWGIQEPEKGFISKKIGDPSQLDKEEREKLYELLALILDPTHSSKLTEEQEELFDEHFGEIRKLTVALNTDSNGVNYAVSNAAIGTYSGVSGAFFKLFNLDNQTGFHINATEPSDISSNKSLHLITMGGNDIMFIANDASTDIQEKEQKVVDVAGTYIEQILKLINAGAKKIVVVTAPPLGDIPAFHDDPDLSKMANDLSKFFDQEISDTIKMRFNPNAVRFISLAELKDKYIKNWSKDKWFIGCVQDIANGYFDLEHFIATGGELKTSFANGCSEQLLKEGSYFYFDQIHGTDAAYRTILPDYITVINDLMGISEQSPQASATTVE